MASKLEKAVEIYRSLGYEETDFEDILKLGLGSKEEQKIAKEGLKSGEWAQVKQLSENSYGFVPIVDVDLGKLAIFAIRVGVDAKRAANLLRGGSEIALKTIEARGKNYAMDFIKAACTSNRRIWEHSLSVLGMLAVKLVHQMELEIPESAEYMKDWAAVAAGVLKPKRKDRNIDENFVIEKEEIIRRFIEHIEAGISVNVPATGPFSKVLIWGVENNVLTKEESIDQVFYALNIAQRPGDRKELVNVLEQIGLTDNDIKSRAETIIPLLGLGESALLERFAPILIESASKDLLYHVLIACSFAKVKKIKKIILTAALKRERPKSVKEYEEWLLLYKQDEDKSISKLAKTIEKAWGLEVEKDDVKEEVQGLWRKTPKLWEVPKFKLGEVSSEALTDLAAVISERKECVEDITFERFIAMANSIAYKNPDEAKMSLAGIPSNDSSIIRILGRWAKNIENNICPDSIRKVWNGENETVKLVYGELLYTRSAVLFASIDKFPCLLSTPSYEDLSISLDDLVARLLIYKNKNLSYVPEPDLQLALTRLDMDLITKKDLKEYVEKLSGINLKILLPSGELLQDEGGNDVLAAKIIADYLKDPYMEPEFTPGKTPYWKIELNMPKSLKVLPNRLSYSHDFMFSIFPTWGDYALTAVHRDYEVYHGQGLILRQVARRKKPVTKGALMNWLAISANLSDENAKDVIIATHKAWERGLLLPGIADISYLDWRGGTPSNLASMALSMESMAKDGMLSLVWEAACDTLKVSLEAPRMLAGTAEVVKLLRDYLDEVIFAVENKLAPKSVLKMEAVKKLAAKSGSSKAVGYAKEIVNKLNSFNMEIIKDTEKSKKVSEVKDSPNDFDELWLSLPEPKKLIDDNVSMKVKAIELRKSEKVFQFNLKLPDANEHEYQVTVAGWIYGLRNEGQVSAFEANNKGEIINEDEKAVWLHYDNSKKKIVVSRFRNWRNEENAPLKGEPAPYSKALLTIAVALLAQDGESIYGAKSLFKQLVDSGDLSTDVLRNITRELLLHEEISPAKLVRMVEKERGLLSICYVMLSECIKYAGEKTVENNKPPVWVNRVLDICIYYADYLREAAKRGLIPVEDAKWQGLLEIAKSSAKSAAIQKARSLAKLLGIM